MNNPDNNSEVRMVITGEKGRETATQIFLYVIQYNIGPERITKFQWRCGGMACSPGFNIKSEAIAFANKRAWSAE